MIAVNIFYVSRALGLLILMMSASMLFPFVWEICGGIGNAERPIFNDVSLAILAATGIGAAIGGGLVVLGINARTYLGRREALLLVALSWFVGASVAALPFYLWAHMVDLPEAVDHAFLSYINSYFEAMSGLTTTGSTVLSNIESIPKGLLLWRAFTHWLGGLGIVVIFVALLPSLMGKGTKKLFSVESTGISNEGATPQMKETARVLLFIYLSFTLIGIVLLKLADPSLTWFHSICHVLATLATGGYSTFNASAGALSPLVQWILIVLMVLAGVNFSLYHSAILGKWRVFRRDSEFHLYLALIVMGTVVIAASIWGQTYDLTDGTVSSGKPAQVIRDSLFQVVSIQTTTGFASVNFEQWGLVPKAVLIGLMFVGGCGGSTGGGIKVIRILSVIKIMAVELERAFRPNVMRPVKIGYVSLDNNQRLGVLAYVLGIVVLTLAGSIVLICTEANISGVTALTASISAINNIGPGLEAVGAIENYGWISDPGKLFICLMMAIGRLEVFAVVVVFLPGFWRAK